MSTWTWVGVGALAIVATGCPSDDGGASATETEGGSSTGTPTTSTTSSSSSTTMAESSSSSGDETSTTMAESSSSSSSGDSSSSGKDSCVGMEENDCTHNPECVAIMCQPFDDTQDPVCLGERTFIGCRDAALCGGMRTSTCEAAGSTVYQCGDDCIPDGWDECEPPVPSAHACQ